MRILYASNNKDKIEDIKEGIALISKSIDVVGLVEIGLDIEVEETGETLLENATLKAQTVYDKIKGTNFDNFDFIIGEDFGFYLDAFAGVAGIHAKRWKDGNNLDRASAIVELFETTKETNKKATFSCAMCCINKQGNKFEVLEHLTGNIGTRKPTKDGFGYHQIVQMEDGRYLNDYGAVEKRAIWSRQKALVSILKQINLI